MAPAIAVTRGDLEAQRQRILSKLGVTIEEFAETVATNTLSGEEWEARDRLAEIYFLLDETPAWQHD
jgi:DNA-binding transcriptional regulator YiaG